jgi:hypothetical protein
MPHAPLPNDVESLKELVIAQRAALEAAHVTLLSRDVEIEKLKIELARLKRLRYGRSSEQLDRRIAQLELTLESSKRARRSCQRGPLKLALTLPPRRRCAAPYRPI